MILAVCNTKGGVGKTTLAVNLAIERCLSGQDVLLIDADEQRTASSFTALREEVQGTSGYTCVELSGATVAKQGRALAAKYATVIIDVGGRDTAALRAALAIADAALVPFAVGTFDIWAATDITHLIEEASAFNPALRAYSVLNLADPQGSDNAEAAEVLGEIAAMDYLKAPLVRRKAMRNASAQGLGILELSGSARDGKAAGELSWLAQILFQRLDDLRKTA